MRQKSLVIILIIFMFLFSNVFFHELTHIALNDFRFQGVCVLNCNSMISDGLLGNGYTPFGVYLSNPVNSLAENEGLVWGIATFFSTTLTLALINWKVIQ